MENNTSAEEAKKIYSSAFEALADFRVGKLLGQGAFGKVFKVENAQTKKVYAAKIVTDILTNYAHA